MQTTVTSQRAVSPARSRLVAAEIAGATGSSLPFWSLAILIFVLARACPAADAFSESGRIVSQYKAVFSGPSKGLPAFHAVDSPITGNGDIGLTMSGPPQSQRYWISKNDFWKAGPDFKQAGPSLIGGIDLRMAALDGASYRVEQVLYEPVLASRFVAPAGGAAVAIDARVLAGANLIVLEIRAEGRAVEVELDLWAQAGYGSINGSGSRGDIRWVSRGFDGKDLLYPTHAVVAMRSFPQAPAGTGKFTLEPGKPVTLVASVATNHESPDFADRARRMVADLDDAKLAALRADHDKWWRQFWAKSFVEIEDKLIEKHYYAALYIMACCSRNTAFPPGLFGNWITMDRVAWSGDIHLNYNHQAPYWGLYSSNRLDLTDSYDTPLLESLERFKQNAKKYLNCRGAYADVAIGPKGLSCGFPDAAGMDRLYGKLVPGSPYQQLAGTPMFHGQKSNSVFGAINMLLRYRYTCDGDYARKVYPYLIAVADFWEDYLKLENGRYVIHDDSFQEVGPFNGRGWHKGYGDFNPLLSLGMLRVFFGDLIEIAQDLGRDGDRRAKWADIRSRLSEFPTAEPVEPAQGKRDGRRRFRACEGGIGSSRDAVGLDYVMVQGLIYPATNIGLGSDPEQLKMVRDEMNAWDDDVWIDHGGSFPTVFLGAARVGYDPNILLAKARQVIAKRSPPNLWIFSGGGGIETCSGIPGMINEMMLQSHGGVIRVFPVFPAGQKASFYRLRTFGAFLVSGAINKGVVQPIVIESEKGRPCVLQNPWPGKKVIISSKQSQTREISGDVLRLPTVEGESLTLTPQG